MGFKKKEWVSDRLFYFYPLLLNLHIQEQQAPRVDLMFAGEREQMYLPLFSNVQMLGEGWLEKISKPVEGNIPAPFFFI